MWLVLWERQARGRNLEQLRVFQKREQAKTMALAMTTVRAPSQERALPLVRVR
jgi:hypothetical protein